MRRMGMFGPISVEDIRFSGTGVARCILLDKEVQGGSLLDPPAVDVHPDLPVDAPGPCSESMYTLGWLLAGVAKPISSGIMLGLGPGAGAVQLLHNFPGIDVTVVEIDPAMVQVAIDTYPLLAYYMDQGRLQIVIDDAQSFLLQHTDAWDFGCADVYTGEARLQDESLPLLCQRAKRVYVNCIDRLGGQSMSQIAWKMQQHGRPIQQIFRAVPPGNDNWPWSSCANFILSSDDCDLDALREFEPYCMEEEWQYFVEQEVMQNVIAKSS